MKLKAPDWLKEIFQQDDGGYSSKRMIMIICVIAMLIAYFANLFWKFAIDHYLFDRIREIALGTGSLSALEKFVPGLNKLTGDQSAATPPQK